MSDGKVVYEVRADNSKIDSDLTAGGKLAESSAGRAFAGVGKAIGVAIGAAVIAATAGAVAGVKYNAQMQQYSAAFKVMLGDGTKATKMLTDLRNMAAKTPFELTDLAGASQTLMSFNAVTEDKLLPTLKMLGDASLGDADKMNRLTLAFAQTQSAGRLMGQDLLQMVNAGFNPLQEISKTTGKSMAELRNEMESGAISADMVTEAFASATSEGGRFFGAMDAQSKTFNGQMSTLKDNLKMMLGELTEGIFSKLSTEVMPDLLKYVDWLNKALQEGGLEAFFTELGRIIEYLVINIPGMRENVIPFFEDLGEAVKPLADEILPAFKEIWDGLQTIFEAFATNVAPILKDFFLSVVDSISTLIGEKVLPFLVEQFTEFADSVAAFLDENSEEIKEAFESIAELVQELCDTVGELIDMFETLDGASEDVADAMEFDLGDALKLVIEQITNVTDLLGGLLTILGDVASFVKNAFSNDWSAAWESLQNVAVGAMNAVIDVVNLAISALNMFLSLIGAAQIAKLPSLDPLAPDATLNGGVTGSTKSGTLNGNGSYYQTVYGSTMTDAWAESGGSWDDIWSNAGGWAQGLDWVPYNEFKGRLHKGERILTASDNAIFNALGGLDGLQKSLVGNNFAGASMPSISLNANMQGSVYLDGREVGQIIYQNWNDITNNN